MVLPPLDVSDSLTGRMAVI